MTNLPSNAHPAVAKSLSVWHEIVATKDLSQLSTIVHPEAIFRSPIAIKPYRSGQALVIALSTVVQLFEDFTYYRQLAADDGLNIFLEFSAVVSGKELKGVDLIVFDEQGLIREFEVMVRPLNALQALHAAMAARVGDRLPAFKD